MLPRTVRPLGLIVGLLAGFVLNGAVHAQKGEKAVQKSSPKIVGVFQEVVAKPSLSTVRIRCDGKDTALGTVVSNDGFILTKFSDLKGDVVCRLKDGRELIAKVVGVHDKHDLAMLKVEANDLKPVEWIESKVAPVGNWVASPGVSEAPVAIGVVSVASRNVSSKGPNISAPPANSGYLGVSIDTDGVGVKVAQVLPDTGAAKAGVKTNDKILTVNGKEVADAEAFMNTLMRMKAGDVVKLKLMRGDKEMEIEATLGKRPANANRGDFQNALGSELSIRRTGFPTILQHDSVIKPSDCGGPLVDLDGRVVGINIARAGRTESYAIPSEAVLPLLADLRSGKLAPPVAAIPAAGPSAAELQKIAEAKAAFQKAEADAADAQKRAAEAKALLERLQSELDKKK